MKKEYIVPDISLIVFGSKDMIVTSSILSNEDNKGNNTEIDAISELFGP